MKTFASCADPVPMVTFDQEVGHASILNYNLPASTAFTVRRHIPLGIDKDCWNAAALKPPANNPWETLKEAPELADPQQPAKSIVDQVKDDVFRKYRTREPFVKPGDPVEQLPFAVRELALKYKAFAPLLEFDAQVTVPNEKTPGSSQPEPVFVTKKMAQATSSKLSKSKYGTLSVAEVNEHVAIGQLPIFHRTMYGKVRTQWVAEPAVRPRLVLIEEYEVASFLGDYGAGRTLKTFSLLPGEKTVIAVKSYRTSETSKTKTDNILDSYSEDSADELENIINQENAQAQSDEESLAVGFSSVDTFAFGSSVEVGGGFDIGIAEAGAEGTININTTNTTTNTQTLNSSRANAATKLHKAMDRHVAQTSSSRKIEVNTETSSSTKTTEGEEATTTREIDNLNRSRVLNFVFRQLLQEYLTITSLKRVRIAFTQGFPGDARVADLDNLHGFLSRFLKAECVNEVLTSILDELCNVYDFEGVPHDFIEKVTEEAKSCEDPNVIRTRIYYRKRRGLSQTWKGKTVEGVIVDTAQRILSTDAVVVEALLGQGEALDCYNMQLQDAAVVRAHLENKQREVGIALVEGLPAADKAEAYHQVFNPCFCRPKDD